VALLWPGLNRLRVAHRARSVLVQQPDRPLLQASKSAAAGKATSGHGAASALSRDAFVGGFECGVKIAHVRRSQTKSSGRVTRQLIQSLIQ